MEPGTGDRGVSEVMGFILVFGMLVLSFTIYQGIVVPDQNRQAEFEHNQQVHGQLQDMRNAILSTASTGSGQAVSVKLGASYPTRAIARNLGYSGGAIETIEPNGDGIRIENARATDPETAHYLDGSPKTFNTSSIRYTPVYSFYTEAPQTIYENSLVFNRFADANITTTNQALIDDNRITLIAIDGDLSRSERDTVSIDTEAISTSSNRVSVRNDTAGPINLTVPSRLSVSKWEDILEGEHASDGGGHVEGVHPGPESGYVTIQLENSTTYDLRMAKIGVGDLAEGVEGEYIITVDRDEKRVSADGSVELVAEVRDRFNNPVSGVRVSNQTDTSVGEVSPRSTTTDSAGRASFTYQPDDSIAGDRVNVTVGFGNDSRKENVTFQVNVLDGFFGGSGGGGQGGAGGSKPGGPITNARLDDLSHEGNNGVRYVVSYELSNVDDNFSAVSTTFDDIDQPPASGRSSSADTRGSFEYSQGFGARDTWQISVRAFYDNNESLESVRQFHDVAEGLNPSDNADLGKGNSSSPKIGPGGFNVTDVTGINNRPTYTLNYSIEETDNFQYVEGALLGIGGGGHDYAESSSPQGELELQTDYGDRFQVKLLVYDDDGVVVDYRDLSEEDTPDGSGP